MCTAKQLFCCLVICVTVIIESVVLSRKKEYGPVESSKIARNYGSQINKQIPNDDVVDFNHKSTSFSTECVRILNLEWPISCVKPCFGLIYHYPKTVTPVISLAVLLLQGQCGCCTGYILDRLNQKACLNMTYEPEDFAVSAVMSLNGIPFYKNSISGKNPPPMCFRLPRLRFITLCLEFSNVYFLNRNVHLCVDAEANWADFTLLEWSFDCIRMGLSGVQIVNREDGGGLPEKPIDIEDQTDEDYDDSARNNPNEKLLNYGEKPKIVFHHSLQRLEGKSPDRRLISVKGSMVNGILYIP